MSWRWFNLQWLPSSCHIKPRQVLEHWFPSYCPNCSSFILSLAQSRQYDSWLFLKQNGQVSALWLCVQGFLLLGMFCFFFFPQIFLHFHHHHILHKCYVYIWPLFSLQPSFLSLTSISTLQYQNSLLPNILSSLLFSHWRIEIPPGQKSYFAFSTDFKYPQLFLNTLFVPIPVSKGCLNIFMANWVC